MENITALDDVFLKHLREKKDFLYYIIEFGNLERQNGYSIFDYTKRFNKMYNKILEAIKHIEASARITYSNSIDSKLCLLLRERNPATLTLMQDASLEVESNILAAQKLKVSTDRRKIGE